jgi:TPR repeat protein
MYNDDYSIGSRFLNRAFQASPQNRESSCSFARKTLTPLADQGDCDAQYKVGFMYFTGVCYPMENEKALVYFYKSANQGHVRSAIMLGDLFLQKPNDSSVSYCLDCKLKKDLYTSLKWYKIAEKNSTGNVQVYLEKRYQDIGTDYYQNNILKVEEEVSKFNYKPKKCEQRSTYQTVKVR